MFSRTLALACAAAALVAADSQHVFQQPGASSPVDVPYRPLPWGEVNVIHTTDTHGWLAGHQNHEPSFSGDWGDFYSFVETLKAQAREKNVDLLLVDSGDRVDGNGLVDAEPPEHVKGYTAMQFFKEMPYDVVTTGNHELYKYPVARMVDDELRSFYGERYVVSNVNISVEVDERNHSSTVTPPTSLRPIGSRFRKFKTEQGRSVTALGPLFNFRAHAPGIKVQRPADMIHEAWFSDAIEARPNFFLLVGHMSVGPEQDSEWDAVVRAIRSVHSDVPVLVFGGHHHIRDCTQADALSVSLASGRYMETIGWLAVNVTQSTQQGTLQFERRYLDQNRNTYAFHAGEAFDTPRGREISRELAETSRRFNLTETFGTAPQSYYLSRYPPSDPRSIFHLLSKDVLPATLPNPEGRPRTVVYNTGSVRFDVFAGPFTKNDQWIICPFDNKFEVIEGISAAVVRRLLPYLNRVGEHGLRGGYVRDDDIPSDSFTGTSEEDMTLKGQALWNSDIETRRRRRRVQLARDVQEPPSSGSFSASSYDDDEWVESVYRRKQQESHDRFYTEYTPSDVGLMGLSYGHVTYDNCPGRGDDTLHKPVPYSYQPVFIATDFPDDSPTVDIVFLSFIRIDIISALNKLQKKRVFTDSDSKIYTEDVYSNNLVEKYASQYWK